MKYTFFYLWNRPPPKDTLNSSIYCTIHSPSLHHSKTNFTRFFFDWGTYNSNSCARAKDQKREIEVASVVWHVTRKLTSVRAAQHSWSWPTSSLQMDVAGAEILLEITYPTSSPLDLIFVHGGWLLHQDSFDTLFATIMAESDHVQNLYALFKGSCWKNWSSRRDCRVELAILVRCFLSLLRWFLEVVRAYLPYFFYTWVSPCW